MSYRLVVSDLDGTMYESDLKLCAENMASIKKLLDNGYFFAIATGRPKYSALPVAHKLGLCEENQYVICFQGSIIAEAATGREIFSVYLEHGQGPYMVKEARDKNATVIAYIDGMPYTHYYDKEAVEYSNQVGVKLTIDDSFEDSRKGKYNKVIIRGAPESLKKIESGLAGWAAGRVGCVYSAHNLLEYFNPSASKGRAIMALAEKLGVKREETIAIGDYYNDLPMLEEAGLGVAIKNSPPDILDAAGYVTEKTAGEGAVSEVIEKFVFG